MIKIDNLPEARENKSFQVGIGFGLAFDWLRRWREFFFRPITEPKPEQSRIAFDTQLNTTLFQGGFILKLSPEHSRFLYVNLFLKIGNALSWIFPP